MGSTFVPSADISILLVQRRFYFFERIKDVEMKIAYFTMEIGLNENIPTYSGGLGILAGDHIKSAADLDLPLVAVSLLYKRGYFLQNISPLGWQEEISRLAI